MLRIAGQKDHSTGRMRLQFVGVEFVAKADVEEAGNDRVADVINPRWPTSHRQNDAELCLTAQHSVVGTDFRPRVIHGLRCWRKNLP